MNIISQGSKDGEAEAYEKALDESPITKDQRFKIKGLALTHEAVSKVKKRNLYHQTSSMNRLTKARKKMVKHLGNGWICLSGALKLLETMIRIKVLKKHPLYQEDQTIKLITLKK